MGAAGRASSKTKSFILIGLVSLIALINLHDMTGTSSADLAQSAAAADEQFRKLMAGAEGQESNLPPLKKKRKTLQPYAATLRSKTGCGFAGPHVGVQLLECAGSCGVVIPVLTDAIDECAWMPACKGLNRIARENGQKGYKLSSSQTPQKTDATSNVEACFIKEENALCRDDPLDWKPVDGTHVTRSKSGVAFVGPRGGFIGNCVGGCERHPIIMDALNECSNQPKCKGVTATKVGPSTPYHYELRAGTKIYPSPRGEHSYQKN